MNCEAVQGLARSSRAARFRAVRGGVSWKAAAITSIVVSVAGWIGDARAQLPVCPQPEADKPVYTACLPGGRFLVVPLLANLTIDQLLKADGGPIKLNAHSLFASMASKETVQKNSELTRYLERLDPLLLTRIDTSTGTLKLDLSEEQRSFSGTVTIGESELHAGLQLPARIEGGYWRTPGVVQVAFWKGQRASITTRTVSGAEIKAEIECLVVSADGIRLIPVDSSTPSILVEFGPCD
jgi:hypothetical protein